MVIADRQATAALEQELIQRIGLPRYNLWFQRHVKWAANDDQLVVGVPNLHFQEWLDRTFGGAVREAASTVFGRPMEVRFAIDAELFQEARREQALVTETKPQPKSTEKPAPIPPVRSPQKPAPAPDPRYDTPAETSEAEPQPRRSRRWRRLADFVVGPCNRVAHASALSLVESPEEMANPLVVYGSVGTGKTHLLEGAYVGLRRSRPSWRITFTTAEDFTNRFVQAMRLGKLASFRRHFRDTDALLIDDLHFLARKRATQEEFLHTFDVLMGDGRPMVLTCDCHPRLADEFTPELTDRLLGGAVWGLQPPDGETRLAILRAKVASGEGPVPEVVLRFLAEQLRGNVRELEGALNSLRHFSRVTRRIIDVPLAREALGDLLRHAVRVVRVVDVDAAVCRLLKLEAGTLQSRARAWAVSHPRMVAMFLARKHTTAAYSEIGQHFGGRNHSTAVAAEKKVRQWLADDGELALGERRLRVREVIELVERDLSR